MPTYDYACSACGHQFEHFQSMTATPLKVCPKCARKTLKRLIGTGAGVIFKGAGFYTTDYRSDAYKKAAESESTTAKPEPAKDATATTATKGDAAAVSAAPVGKAAQPNEPAPVRKSENNKPRKKGR